MLLRQGASGASGVHSALFLRERCGQVDGLPPTASLGAHCHEQGLPSPRQRGHCGDSPLR